MAAKVFGLGFFLMLQGCLAGSSPLRAIVEVRDARTGVPIAHAVVRTTGGNVFIPPREVLGPPISPPATPAGGRATTDDAGQADIVLAGSRPNQLTVSATGFATLHLTLETSGDTVRGAQDWAEGRRAPIGTSSPAEPGLEVRVRTR